MTTAGEHRLCVLVLAAGSAWEAPALKALADAGIVVAKRCVDVADLMASSSSGTASVALVDAELAQLDAEAVMHLLRYDVRTLAVSSRVGQTERLGRLGVVETTGPAPADVVTAVRRVAEREVVADPEPPEGRHLDANAAGGGGPVLAVWGPAGSPGRTTVAVGLAGEIAGLGRSTLLVDADPYGGTVAQALGILDEISGLLAVARMANLGMLDPPSLAQSCRRVAGGLDVLTGLPRADRRVEVRPDILTSVLTMASGLGTVVVDCGFCLEDAGVPLARDRMTHDALAAADEIVVVGSAEPSGLSRLARGLVELRDVAPGTPVRVVVNRMRPSLGWSERDIVGMVEGYVGPAAVHFLPEDRPGVDQALVAGRGPWELGESRLRVALADLAAAVTGAAPSAPGRRGRRRQSA